MRVIVLLVCLISLAQPLLGAPITFNTALPVAKGEFVFREQGVVVQSGDDASSADRDRTETAAVIALGFGIYHNLAVFGVLPYRDIKLKLTSSGQQLNRDTRGFGDLNLFGRYTAYQNDQPGQTLRIAPFIGVKMPTGKDDARDGQGTLPPSAQVGSGSWDLFAGTVLTFQTLQYQIDSQISYRAHREANDFEAGDIARLDASLQYRLWPDRLGHGVPDYLYGVLETNLLYREKNKISEVKDANSGGTQWFLSPGIQYVTKRWILEGAVQIPVLQNLNGTALENDYIIRAGVRINF